MRFIIITGMSGAGKSQAARSLEDMGYFCIDNMPSSLIPKFAEICFGAKGKFDRVALVSDIRSGTSFDQLFDGLDELKNDGYDCEILFLEADDQIIIKRYKETRRKHPLAMDGSLVEAVAKERELLEEVRNRATYIIDTSDKLPGQLRKEMLDIFEPAAKVNGLVVNMVSFGFKYGIPLDADIVMDVRFLPNPFYIPELKKLSGLDVSVAEYVMNFPQSKMVLEKLCDLIDYLIPYYIDEGKSQLVVAIGCTGGRHRSVTIAEAIHKHLRDKAQRTAIAHRDCEK